MDKEIRIRIKPSDTLFFDISQIRDLFSLDEVLR
jgi:hypothetical protein